MKAQYSHYSDIDKACLHRLQLLGKTPSVVAEMMGRDLSSVVRHFKRSTDKTKKSPRGAGRPRRLTEGQIDRLAKTTKKMVKAANSEYQVTAGMVRRESKLLGGSVRRKDPWEPPGALGPDSAIFLSILIAEGHV